MADEERAERPSGELIESLQRVCDVLDQLTIPHCVVGSYASSIHGVPRATNDVDVIADLIPEKAAPLVDALHSEFVAESAPIRDAIARSGTFNLIHRRWLHTIDIFVVGEDPWSREQIRRSLEVDLPGSERVLRVASAEDTVLAKLVWYRKGNEVSDRQWNDVLGVLRTSGDELDLALMNQCAERLVIVDLLERALIECAR